ncbi:flavin reductase [Oscillospiraceae bacterium MB08-C2-2]|nr:flavin reductase [Oscillospiraceae bacterium MB08-C2-2]
MKEFQKIDPKEMPGNAIQRIGDDWMLITTKRGEEINTMTANWGGMGFLWHKPVVFLFVRPQRYTREFLDAGEEFTLSFYDRSFRPQMTLCGKQSGRDINKVEACHFTPRMFENAPAFEEAETVIACRKLFCQVQTEENFLDPSLLTSFYPDKDYHHFYVAEITGVYVEKK